MEIAGWLLGTLLGIALVITFNVGVVPSFFIGFVLSYVGILAGSYVSKRIN